MERDWRGANFRRRLDGRRIMLRMLGVGALCIAVILMGDLVCGIGIGYGVICLTALKNDEIVTAMVATVATGFMMTVAVIAIYKITGLIWRLVRNSFC